MPITIVNFEVFDPVDGSQLLMCEVTEDEARPPRREGTRHSVEAIRHRAREEGVGVPFDRFLDMAKEAGLVVRPYSRAVMIAPPANRSRFLMYARPDSGRIVLSAGPAQEATAAIGPYERGGAPHLAGAEL